MLRIFACAATAASVFAGCAAAQLSADFNAELEAAYTAAQGEDWAGAVAEAEAALAVADTEEERFRAHAALAQIGWETENWPLTFDNAGAAIAILDAHFPNSPDALSEMLGRQATAALMMGRRTEGHALTERRINLNRESEELRFRFEDLTVRHRFTGYPCPIVEGDAVFEEARTFDPSGIDVSCAYAWPGSPQPVITVHVYRMGDIGHEQAFEDARTNVASVFPEATETGRDTSDIAGYPVSHARWTMPDRQAYLWTTQVNDWTLKLRVTTFRELAEADFAAMAQMVFSGAPAMAAHLERCAALTGVDTLESTEEDNGLAAAFTSIVVDDDAERLVAPDAGDNLQCLIGENPMGGGGVTYAELNADGNAVRFVARPVRPNGQEIRSEPPLFLPEVEETTGEPWSLYVADTEGRTIYPRFTDQPSPDGFARLAGQLIAGEVEPVARITENEEGGNNIQLFGFTDEITDGVLEEVEAEALAPEEPKD